MCVCACLCAPVCVCACACVHVLQLICSFALLHVMMNTLTVCEQKLGQAPHQVRHFGGLMSSLVSPLLTSPSPSAPGADSSPVAAPVPSAPPAGLGLLPSVPGATLVSERASLAPSVPGATLVSEGASLAPSVPGATLVSEGASPAPSAEEVVLLPTVVADAEALIRLLKNWLRMIFSSSLA